MKVTSAEWTLRVGRSWEAQVLNCEDHAGLDESMHGLCSHKENDACMMQQGGTKRCNIYNCPRAEEVYIRAKQVNITVARINKPVGETSARVIGQSI